MGKILTMPGTACTLYMVGRCLYDEVLNPGLHDAFLCTEVLRLMATYDRGMQRYDDMALSDGEFARMLERLMTAVSPPGSRCADFYAGWGSIAEDKFDSATEDMPCVHAVGNICILRLPECRGVCHKFRARHARNAVEYVVGRV